MVRWQVDYQWKFVANHRVCRQQLKMSLKSEAADDSRLVENMAVEVLVTGKVSQLSSIDKDVDAVTVESMRKVGMNPLMVLAMSLTVANRVVLYLIFQHDKCINF